MDIRASRANRTACGQTKHAGLRLLLPASDDEAADVSLEALLDAPVRPYDDGHHGAIAAGFVPPYPASLDPPPPASHPPRLPPFGELPAGGPAPGCLRNGKG